jgi:hypothetical protein
VKNIITNFRNLIIRNKFIKFNQDAFDNKFKKLNKKILVEFNAFQQTHCFMSVIANYLAQKNSANLVAFNNYKLTAQNFEESIFKKIKFMIAKFFKFNFFGIYNSFGVTDFIRPTTNIKNRLKAEKITNHIFFHIKSKSDVLNIKIDKILLGDLIYDGFLKFYSLETLSYNSLKFKKYLYEFVLIYIFWKEYLSKNIIKGIVGVHGVYAYGIIYRIAFTKKIEVFTTISGRVFRLDKKNQFNFDEYKYFKKIFSKYSTSDKKKIIKYSKNILQKRFEGAVGNDIKELISNKSAFARPFEKKNKILNNNNKIKILIATHQLGDTCNFWGTNFFPDFYEWLKFLSAFAKETDYEWYIKDHPRYLGLKYTKSLDRTSELTKKLVKENNNLIHLPPDVSHNQIINENIDFVLTIYGTIAFEYAYFKIPVILATKNSPTYNYSFNIRPSDVDEYKKILKNLKKIKLKIKEKEVLEYFFMRYIYNDYNFFFDKYGDFLNKKNNWDDYDSFKFYKYWIDNVDLYKKGEMFIIFDSFYKSKKHTIDLSHNSKLSEELRKNYQCL